MKQETSNRTVHELSVELLEPRLLLSVSLFPTEYEQLMLELINRARANPAAEADRYRINLNEGIPADELITTESKQPVTFNLDLIEAARGHNQWMMANDIFQHEGMNNSSPGDRMEAAGYEFSGSAWGWGENLAWSGQGGVSPDTLVFTRRLHENLFVDDDYPDRGHRTNMMNFRHKEVGVGVQTGVFSAGGINYNAVMSTIDFAWVTGDNFLTGVAYDEEVKDDDFYTPGEGIGGLTVKAIRQDDGETYTTTTWASGGYSLPLPEGVFDVYVTGFELNFIHYHAGQITMDGQNVKVDFPLDIIQRPDLVISGLDYTAGDYDPGDEITIALTQENQGLTSVSSGQKYKIELRFSVDPIWGNADDMILSPLSRVKSGLRAGDSKMLQKIFSIPAEIPAGSYYVAAWIDSTNTVSEDDETNNIFWSDSKDITMTNIRRLDSSRSARYYDADYDLVSVILKGPGTGSVIQSDSGDAFQILLNGTDASSSLTIKTTGRDSTTVHTILVEGSLKTIKAKHLDLTGSLQVAGSLNKIQLNDIADHAQVTVTGESDRGLTVKTDQIGSDVEFDLAGYLKNFRANYFNSGALLADSIGKVKVKFGDLNVDIKAALGDINSIFASGDVNGVLSAAGSIAKVKSKSGDFTGTVRAGDEIGSLKAQNILHAIVSAGGDINKVKIKGNIYDSYLLAGYDVGSDGQFGLQHTGGDDILDSGNVNSVTAKGQFSRSYMAAGTLPYAPLTDQLTSVGQIDDYGSILKIKFNSIDTLNATRVFGLYAVNEIKPFKIGKEIAEAEGFFQIESNLM